MGPGATAQLPPRPNVPARPVPERDRRAVRLQARGLHHQGEPHLRPGARGHARRATATSALCIFGEDVTPNQHKIAREFVLLDNTRCSGILSADGHQWTDRAFATDYMEKSFAGFPRSYPYYGDDAMAYSPTDSFGTTCWPMASRCATTANSRATRWNGRTRRSAARPATWTSTATSCRAQAGFRWPARQRSSPSVLTSAPTRSASR